MRNFFICTFFLAFASAATLINVSLNTIQNEWIWSGNCSGGSVWFNGAATLTNRPVLYSTREFDAANGCGYRIEGRWKFTSVGDNFGCSIRTSAIQSNAPVCSISDGILFYYFQGAQSQVTLAQGSNFVLANISSNGTNNLAQTDPALFNITDDGRMITIAFKNENSGTTTYSSAIVVNGTSLKNYISFSNREYSQGITRESQLDYIRVFTLSDPTLPATPNVTSAGLTATFQTQYISFANLFPPKATIYWGDGTSTNVTSSLALAGLWKIDPVTHNYPSIGVYQVTFVYGDHCGLFYNASVGVTIATPTTSPLTTSPLTTSPLTTGEITSGEVTSGDYTSGELTSSEMTTASLTTSVPTTGSLTTSPLTTASEPAGESSSSNDRPRVGLAVIAGAAGGGGGALLILIVLVALLVRRNQNKKREVRDIELPAVAVQKDLNEDFGDFVISYKDLKFGSKLGEGAFGVVFKGIYKHSEVAIKQLSEKGLSDSLEDFIAEAKTMKALPNHPNVVMFRGVSVPPDPVCIVTDYYNGGALLAKLRKHTDISEDEKLSWSIDIARGMLHLHTSMKNKELIHRDLAARNILLKKDGTAAVADFGLARIKKDEDEQSTTKSDVGPLKWMAPECAKDKVYSTKSDVFAYGVVLYEIYTQLEPWKGMSGVQAITRVMAGERMEIPKKVVPSFIVDLMKRCWSQDPAKRPNFEEILNLLVPRKSSGASQSNVSNAHYEKTPSAPQSKEKMESKHYTAIEKREGDYHTNHSSDSDSK